ncbi:zinc finger protein 708 [Ceratitis capitata]|uniref:zinc finger protein 708 n=1 Tax=Ceratitis capitata TaxID=7213 RepID=UPI000329FAC0|nr:zinc finger protein 708 [Ceratitis capitata]
MNENSIKTYCRACMRVIFEGAVNLNYSVLADAKTLFTYFTACTQLRAELGDELPQILCRSCAQHLQDAYNFIRKAKQTEKKLKKILAEQKAKNHGANGQQENIMHFEYDPLEEVATMECGSDLDTGSERKDEDDMKADDNNSELEVTELNLISERNDEDTEDGINDGDDKNVSITKDNSKGSVKHNCADNDFIVDLDSDYSMQSDEEEKDIVISKNNRVVHTGCSLCDYKYTTLSKLKEHIFQMHKSHILCLKCPKVYEFPNELQMHEYLVHATESPMQCNWCRQTFKREELPKHFQNRHWDAHKKYFPQNRSLGQSTSDTSEFPCESCEKSFPSILELADHTKECKFNCPICLKSFKKLCSYRAHLRRIHDRTIRSIKKEFKGGQEQQESTIREEMESESNQHSDKEDNSTKLYACPFCDKLFKHRTSFYNHKTQEHQDMTSTDDNSTSANVEIEESKLKYPDKSAKKFLCSFCPRDFSTELSVKSHEKKIHLGERPEQEPCPICKKKFDPIYLKKHMQSVHTSERKFICDVCGVSFKSYLLMYSHKLLHFERNFQCTICKKKFIRSSDLKVHMRMHTGEEPFACHICDKRFKIRVRLTYHLKQHEGHKWKCKECGKEFNQIKQLKNHSYKHTGMPYRCSLCHYACAERNNLRKHLHRVHNMTLTNEEYNDMFRENTGRNSHVKTLEELKFEEQSLELELQAEDQSNKHDESS